MGNETSESVHEDRDTKNKINSFLHTHPNILIT
jgi:hypothetical protein